jgi:hypothetical protein
MASRAMPSAPPDRAAVNRSDEPGARAVIPRAAPGPWAPAMLVGALLVTCLYAAFAHGAVSSPDEERVQLGRAVVALLAAAVWCWQGAPVPDAPGLVRAGLGSLIAFAAWSGVSVLWSVAPDRTWTECNRAITDCLVLVLALAVGASLRRGGGS